MDKKLSQVDATERIKGISLYTLGGERLFDGENEIRDIT